MPITIAKTNGDKEISGKLIIPNSRNRTKYFPVTGKYEY